MSSTSNSRFAARYSSTDSSTAPARERLHPQARGERLPHRVRIGDRRELTQPRTVGEVGDDLRRRPATRGGSCRRRRHRSASPTTTRAPNRASAAISVSRPTNVVTWRGRLPGSDVNDRNGGNSEPRPGHSTWNTCTDDWRSRSRCSPRSTSVNRSRTKSPTAPGTDDLAAVRDRHQSCRRDSRQDRSSRHPAPSPDRHADPSGPATRHPRASPPRRARAEPRPPRPHRHARPRTPRTPRRRCSSPHARRVPRSRHATVRRARPTPSASPRAVPPTTASNPRRSVNRNVTVAAVGCGTNRTLRRRSRMARLWITTSAAMRLPEGRRSYRLPLLGGP